MQDHPLLVGGECSESQLPSAPGSSFLYETGGLLEPGAFIQFRFWSIFVSDVEGCILGVSFLTETPGFVLGLFLPVTVMVGSIL